MMLSIIIGFIFITVTFLAYASNILFLWELIPLALLLLPIYLYCRKRKVLNVYFAVGTIYTGARFYMNMLLSKQHADKILLPVSIDQQIIRQFTGLTVIIALFIWYTYILYATLISINDIYTKAESCRELLSNKQIQIFKNLFKSTTVVVLLEIILMVWLYDLTSVTIRMLTFVLIIYIMYLGFFVITNKAEKAARIRINGGIAEVIEDAQGRMEEGSDLGNTLEENGFEVAYIDADSDNHNSEE